MTPDRPILRYFGGKFRMAPWLVAQLPAHAVYVEPFGGAGSVLIHKDRAKAEVFNDVDGEIVNLFKVLRDNGQKLIEQLRFTPYARKEFKLSHEPAAEPIEQARRTIIRSFFGIGAMRTYVKLDGSISASGFEKSTSWNRGATASMAWANFPDSLHAIIDRLAGVIIEDKDALEVMHDHDAEQTLHYVDPPYCHNSRPDARKSRYRHEMKIDDHEGLAATLERMRGMVIISGYRCPLYDRLYAHWERRDFSAMAFLQKPRTECIWLRNIAGDLFSGK